MEQTQRLELTQELYGSQNVAPTPEQVGFLGICGSKYPVCKGPNKIGRDPQTCSIVLNLNSISRHHAVINVLNRKDVMLMDLESSNKTKLSGQQLNPYIPHPLHNGDTVQFGEVFGIFRYLKEEDELPMTQDIDVLDTPVPTKPMSRLNMITTIPESPDASDKDDSFIIPSQSNGHQFQNLQTRNFIKPGKTISIQPVGTNKIDNIYWSSSKTSTSLNLEDSNCGLNDSVPAVRLKTEEHVSNDIHELETQEVLPDQKLNTPVLNDEDHAANIHSLNTQMASETSSPSIHYVNTQMPEVFGSPPHLEPFNKNLPEVCKFVDEQDNELHLYAKQNNNNNSIHDAETQISVVKDNNNTPVITESNPELNTSNEELMFREVDDHSFEGDLESQAILLDHVELPINRLVEEEIELQMVKPTSAKRSMRIKSDSSIDMDDIEILPPLKQINEKTKYDDDSTDCEEEVIQPKTNKNMINGPLSTKPAEKFEDMPTQVIEIDEGLSETIADVDIADEPTQVLDIINIETKENSNTNFDLEDLPTQVLDEDLPTIRLSIAQQLSNKEDIGPFKVPSTSVLKAKMKDGPKTPKIKFKSFMSNDISKDMNFYDNTQDIYDDLSSQRLETGEAIEKPLNRSISGESEGECEIEKKIHDFITNLSSQEVRDVVGVGRSGTPVSQLKKVSSNESTPSDLETTPKKRPFQFMDTDLPNSLEIKTTVKTSARTVVHELSSDSDTEHKSEDQCTPILFRKKKRKVKQEVKINLNNKFDIVGLPVRAISGIEKPTAKIKERQKRKGNENTIKSNNIIKSPFLESQEDVIDKDIITENITRLKSKNEKSKSAKSHDLNKQSSNHSHVNKESIAENVKDRASRKKNEENKRKNNEKQPVKVHDSRKDETTKKIDSKNTKKDLVDPKKQPNINKNSKQSHDSILKSKDKTQSSNKSKEIKTIDLSESPVKTKRSTRSTTRNDKKDNSSRTENKPTARTENKPTSRTENKPTSRTENKSTSRTENKSTSRTENKPTLRTENKSTSRTEDKPTSRSENKPTSRTENKSTSRTENKSISRTSPKNDSQSDKPEKRTYTRRNQEHKVYDKKQIEKGSSREIARRSYRHRSSKEKKEPAVIKSILKSSSIVHEESAVYDLSSGSISDSSRSIKRPALDDSEAPSAKKTRHANVINSVVKVIPPRSNVNSHYVLLSTCTYNAFGEKLKNIGAVIVKDVLSCTVLLTTQVKRTVKMMCAIGLGKPIVGPSWVDACVKANRIVDPWLHIIADEAAEKRYFFSMKRSLTGHRDFLRGYNVSATATVVPTADELKMIVECSGGTWQEGGPRWICLSTFQEKELWPELWERGADIVSPEFILTGVFQQKINIDLYKIYK